ncbi:hypothetical protein [Kribbella speibonae]|uniref:Uncharacterized protein n=1 Tax=Kribbella speibonae TaxID=1572660 RepID=A0A4V2M3D9_9ACTN|nr:hypothetical protein [Kribbella speibonae]TCC31652.1 hypothetical protein E0H92_34435 [Kribbella speibonae]
MHPNPRPETDADPFAASDPERPADRGTDPRAAADADRAGDPDPFAEGDAESAADRSADPGAAAAGSGSDVCDAVGAAGYSDAVSAGGAADADRAGYAVCRADSHARAARDPDAAADGPVAR